MTQAPAAIFKIPTESPQPARGRASRARRAPAPQPKAPSRVLRIETRAATRGEGDVIELDLGITVYPPRQQSGRWRAVWQKIVSAAPLRARATGSTGCCPLWSAQASRAATWLTRCWPGSTGRPVTARCRPRRPRWRESRRCWSTPDGPTWETSRERA